MTNTKPLLFLWVDDKKERENYCKQIALLNPYKGIKANARFLLVKGKNPGEEFVNFVKQNTAPDLVIMDHFLNRGNLPEWVPASGSTVAEYIRESHQIPIIAVTAAEMHEVQKHRDAYEDVFDLIYARKHIAAFYSIAMGFRKLKTIRTADKARLLALLGPNQEDTFKLQSILPDDLIENGKILSSRFFRWTWNIFLKKPGLLYNREWIATFLGLKVEGFNKVEHLFAKAKYDGIFATLGTPLWWPSKAKELLHLHTKKAKSDIPWERGRSLPELLAADFSQCPYCKKPFPEILAYTDETCKRQVPAHLGCTVACAGASKSLFFEEDRRLKDE